METRVSPAVVVVVLILVAAILLALYYLVVDKPPAVSDASEPIVDLAPVVQAENEVPSCEERSGEQAAADNGPTGAATTPAPDQEAKPAGEAQSSHASPDSAAEPGAAATDQP